MTSDTEAEHVIRQNGITVEKRPGVLRDFYLDHAAELTVTNETRDRRAVRVVESIPDGCRADDTVVRWNGISESRISTAVRDGDISIKLGLNPGETAQVTYCPRPDGDDPYQRLLNEPPLIAAVEVRQKESRDESDTTSHTDPSDPERLMHPTGVLDEPVDGVHPPPDIDFGNVAGLDKVKRELKAEIVEPFLDPRFDEYDIGKANGVLLYGPPGTGKTHVATALAGELGYNFFEIEGGRLRESQLGGTQENIARVFESARTHQPCVVFFDELDSIAPERDGRLHQSRAEAVNELLRYIGEINERNEDVVVIGATNRPDSVDDALKRTGRFDTRIKIGMPNEATRVAILEHELRQFDGRVESVWLDPEFLDEFVEATSNFAASDIVEVVEAAQRASLRRTGRDEPPQITADLLLEQVDETDEKQEADTAGEFLTETPEIDFSDVGGMDETKARLEETLLDPLENPDMYEQYGLEISNGVLLYGPPGTGKTYLSRALAGEAGCSFLPITASDIVSKWIGEAAQNIQDLFEKARDVAPAIVFVDEIDAIARSRGGLNMSNSEQQAVNELLAQISELDDDDVFVVGTTNRLDIVDEAVTRAGRLGETIEVPPPDRKARIAILQQQLSDRPLTGETIDWKKIGELTETDAGTAPYVAADLAKIADEAARAAMQEAEDEIIPIAQSHIEQAVENVSPSLIDTSE